MTKYSPTIACCEEHNSVSETYNNELGTMDASVTLRCAYADRHLLVADICGNRRAWPKGAAGVVPLAATASIAPDGASAITDGDGQILTYLTALVTIGYTTKIVELSSESIEPFNEFITLDYEDFRWGTGLTDDPASVLESNQAPAKLSRGINYVKTAYNLPISSLTAPIIDLVGYVNEDSVTWSILGFTSDPETLLYAPPSITWKKDSTNALKFDVVKKFTYRPTGWNQFYRPIVDDYERIYPYGSSDPFYIYPLGTFGGVLL